MKLATDRKNITCAKNLTESQPDTLELHVLIPGSVDRHYLLPNLLLPTFIVSINANN